MTSAEQLRSRVKDKLQQQRAMTLALLRLREQLGGSLFARYSECGKEACGCRQGQKLGMHGHPGRGTHEAQARDPSGVERSRGERSQGAH